MRFRDISNSVSFKLGPARKLLASFMLICVIPIVTTTEAALSSRERCSGDSESFNNGQDCWQSADKGSGTVLNRNTVEPYVSTGWLLDAQGYEDALRLSERYNVPILVYAYTDWCQYCRRLELSLLRDVQVNLVMSRFVKVKINPENSEANQRMFRQWGGRGFPTLFVQGVDDHQPKRIRGPFSKQNGRWQIMGRVEFMRLLGAWL
jgi:thiol-disulfide isomerase/thioredoxin